MRDFPDADPVGAFDVVRPLADKRFEEMIRGSCVGYRSRSLLEGERRSRFGSEDVLKQKSMVPPEQDIDILYVDKNNTPDKWENISKLMSTIQSEEEDRSIVQSVLLIPKQAPFDETLYKTKNQVSPQFVYECFFRVFSRKNHCLSNENKPKAVEVLFKYMKLFDGIDFSAPQPLFNHTLQIDFVNYEEQ